MVTWMRRPVMSQLNNPNQAHFHWLIINLRASIEAKSANFALVISQRVHHQPGLLLSEVKQTCLGPDFRIVRWRWWFWSYNCRTAAKPVNEYCQHVFWWLGWAEGILILMRNGYKTLYPYCPSLLFCVLTFEPNPNLMQRDGPGWTRQLKSCFLFLGKI